LSQYWHWLVVVSVGVAVLERLSPWRPAQRVFRRSILSDLIYLVLNGHFFGIGLAWTGAHLLAGLPAVPDLDIATGWPVWLQLLVALVGLDLIQWSVHNLLHRIPALWSIHKVHHSAQDLDWVANFRFHWGELVVYRLAQYLPLAVMGFAPEVMLVHAVLGTLVGHLNHANLDWDYGPFRYLLNNPRMHIWHHAWDEVPPTGANFGVVLSCWDYLFGTVYLPETRGAVPVRLGFEGLEHFPDDIVRQLVLPLRLGASRSRTHIAVRCEDDPPGAAGS
jgi:sterol desaturase/sphingolipid hydroxylase (fatty acid hydroxylase superfamily)